MVLLKFSSHVFSSKPCLMQPMADGNSCFAFGHTSQRQGCPRKSITNDAFKAVCTCCQLHRARACRRRRQIDIQTDDRPGGGGPLFAQGDWEAEKKNLPAVLTNK